MGMAMPPYDAADNGLPSRGLPIVPPSVRDATPERDALERLSEAATPGPWRARLYDGRWQVVDPDNDVVAECDGPSDQDNAFIAAAVNYLRAALAGDPETGQT